MNKKKTIVYVIIAVIIAIILGAIFVYFLITPAKTPKTQHLIVEIWHEDSWARPAGEEARLPAETNVVTQYVWRPNGLYVFKDDTVVLRVINNSGTRVHSFVLPDFGVDTGPLLPKSEKIVTFVADKTGTFKFRCGTSHDPTIEPKHCDPGHAYQIGYFVVLER